MSILFFTINKSNTEIFSRKTCHVLDLCGLPNSSRFNKSLKEKIED